jgi:hypothetical protein
MRGILTDMMSAYDNKGDNNMTTVEQLISWLQTLPQDAIVEVGKEFSRDWHSGMDMVDLDISECFIYEFGKNTIVQLRGE